jgi:hypothetical protein
MAAVGTILVGILEAVACQVDRILVVDILVVVAFQVEDTDLEGKLAELQVKDTSHSLLVVDKMVDFHSQVHHHDALLQ